MLVSDLMALGMPASEAHYLGNNVQSVTGVSTTQATGATIYRGAHVVLLTAATTTAQAATLASDISVGTPIYVLGAGTVVTGTVFCPVSGSMNGTSNGSVDLATGKSAVFIQTSPKVWVSIPLAP